MVLLLWDAVFTSMAWPTPAEVVRAGAVQVMLVADTTVRPVQLLPPTVTAVAPLMLLNRVPVMVIAPPVMATVVGETLVTVAAPR